MIKINNVTKPKSSSFIFYNRKEYELINSNLDNIKNVDKIINKLLSNKSQKNPEKKQKACFIYDTHKELKKHVFNKRDGIFFINCAGYMAACGLSLVCFIPLAPYVIGFLSAMLLTGVICSLAMAKISFVDAKKAYSELADKINKMLPEFSQKQQTLSKLFAACSKLLKIHLSNPKPRINNLKSFNHKKESSPKNYLLKKALINSYNLKKDKMTPLLQRRDTSMDIDNHFLKSHSDNKTLKFE